MMDSAALTPKRSSKWITRCGGCDETVTREDALKGQVVSAAGRLYHRSHFHCSSCKANLPNLEYYPSGNSVTCLDCYLEENNPRCEDGEYLILDGKFYDEDCYYTTKYNLTKLL
ncbi:hypothetical protein V3C99_003718 [Haemonchus contortus]